MLTLPYMLTESSRDTTLTWILLEVILNHKLGFLNGCGALQLFGLSTLSLGSSCFLGENPFLPHCGSVRMKLPGASPGCTCGHFSTNPDALCQPGPSWAAYFFPLCQSVPRSFQYCWGFWRISSLPHYFHFHWCSIAELYHWHAVKLTPIKYAIH